MQPDDFSCQDHSKVSLDKLSSTWNRHRQRILGMFLLAKLPENIHAVVHLAEDNHQRGKATEWGGANVYVWSFINHLKYNG